MLYNCRACICSCAHMYLACKRHIHKPAPPISIFTHSKCPLHQASAHYGEKWRFMVEHPWVLAWDTMVCVKQHFRPSISVDHQLCLHHYLCILWLFYSQVRKQISHGLMLQALRLTFRVVYGILWVVYMYAMFIPPVCTPIKFQHLIQPYDLMKINTPRKLQAIWY